MENLNKIIGILLGAFISFALILTALVLGICYTIYLSNITYSLSIFSRVIIIVCYVLLVISIVNGGEGIDKMRNRLYNNDLNIHYKGKNYFNLQALYLLISPLLLLSLIFFL